ncbi:MAG: hypothetical protein F6J93_23865 [Oscillatoria sp. SIO1A7]|nr:hypothetical protein [Oscillatoria sp. SIO1A7]
MEPQRDKTTGAKRDRLSSRDLAAIARGHLAGMIILEKDPSHFLTTKAMSRSLRVSSKNIEKVKFALKRNNYPSQNAFASEVGLSRATVTSFLNGRPVDFLNFTEICEKLGLNWQEIAHQDFEEQNDPAPPEAVKSQNWNGAPDASIFYGREKEIAELKEWILTDNCRLVAVLGMSGIGKTALSVKLAKKIQPEFTCLIWRSLRNPPSVADLLADLLQTLSPQSGQQPSDSTDENISRLLQYFQDHRCLVVLDNWQSILKSGDFAGHYREEYRDYGELLRRVAEESHQSCLVLTSSEKPREIAFLEGETLPVRSLVVGDLGEEARKILQAKGLSGEEEWGRLIFLYRGNPLALKIIATTIKDLFAGDVGQFFKHSLALDVGNIRGIVEQQFLRLSPLERDMMYWLAIEEQPLSLKDLRGLFSGYKFSQVVNTLESLDLRSLVEKAEEEVGSKFTLQPAVMQYVTNHLVEKICQEIASFSKNQQFKLLGNYPLQKPQNSDGQTGQPRRIFVWIKNQLYTEGNFSNNSSVLENLEEIKASLQGKPAIEVGYAGENVEILLKALNAE